MDGNGETDALPEPCPWCSGDALPVFHSVACPRVKAIEYHANGRVRRVELTPMPQEVE